MRSFDGLLAATSKLGYSQCNLLKQGRRPVLSERSHNKICKSDSRKFVLSLQPSYHDCGIAVGLLIPLYYHPRMIPSHLLLDTTVLHCLYLENKKRLISPHTVSRHVNHQNSLPVALTTSMDFGPHGLGAFEVIRLPLQELICYGSLIHIANVT